MNEDRVSPEEEAEAAALAVALDSKVLGHEQASPDALGAATLLRQTTGAELSPDRQAVVLQRVMTALPAQSARTPGLWRWFAPVGGLAATAALVLVLALPSDPGATRLPVPGTGLLRSQVRVTSGDEPARADLQESMRAYRKGMFTALAGRYGEKP